MKRIKRLDFHLSILACLWGLFPPLVYSQSDAAVCADKLLRNDINYKLVYSKNKPILSWLKSLQCQVIYHDDFDTISVTYFKPAYEINLSDFTILDPGLRVKPSLISKEELFIKRMDRTVNYINAAHQIFPNPLIQ